MLGRICWLGLLCFSLLTACKPDDKQEELDFDKVDTSVEQVQNVDLLYSDSAIVRVRIRGPVMLNHLEFNDPHQEFPNGIKVEFFDLAGRVTSVLTAKYAVRYETRGLTLVRDSVVWRSTEWKQLETPELTWDERQQIVYTKKFVVVTTPQDTVYSHGFQSTQDFRNISLNAVDGTMEVKQAVGQQDAGNGQ